MFNKNAGIQLDDKMGSPETTREIRGMSRVKI
jgi:hypothetical protein